MEKVKKTRKKRGQKVDQESDFVSWYEIPTADLDRAVHFYSSIFSIQFEKNHVGNHTMAFFPSSTGIGGALVMGEGCIPSPTGPLLYLNAGSSLDKVLEKVSASGGQVLMGKTLINQDIGYYALILDSEGNRIALNFKS